MLSSTAGAAEYLGNWLGEFVEAGEHGGKPFFRQRDTEGSKPQYLYFEDSCWQVSVTLGNGNHYIRNCRDTQLPPTRSWEYWWATFWTEGWGDDDTSLTLEFTSLSPCQLVRVACRQGKVRWWRRVGASWATTGQNISVCRISSRVNYHHPKIFE